MEKLNLTHTKPLAFIKVQTTGLNPETDRIIELSITRVEPDGKKKTGTRLVNPGIAIPEDATKKNGITNEMVKDKPTFKEMAENLSKFVEGCDFVGFGIGRFDLRFLSEEFNRAEVEFTLLGRKVLDISSIYNTMEPRDLNAAYSFYCGKSNTGNVNSEKTTEMYFGIVNGMMEKYNGKEYTDKEGVVRKVEANIEAINEGFNKHKKQLDIEGKIILNEAGRPIFTFGKANNQIVSEALLKDEPYYDWLVNISTLPADTKLIIKKIFAKAKSAAAVAK